MNSNPRNPIGSDSGEETLRLIASLPAPQGLEDRVRKALRNAPRAGRVLAWPKGHGLKVSFRSNSMRTAAAAAIVFVVVGGGWGIYSRIAQVQNGKVITMPARIPVSGGFSGAGAIRTPQTIPGPTVSGLGNQRAREQESRPAKNNRSSGKSHRTIPAKLTPQPTVLDRAEPDQ